MTSSPTVWPICRPISCESSSWGPIPSPATGRPIVARKWPKPVDRLTNGSLRFVLASRTDGDEEGLLERGDAGACAGDDLGDRASTDVLVDDVEQLLDVEGLG